MKVLKIVNKERQNRIAFAESITISWLDGACHTGFVTFSDKEMTRFMIDMNKEIENMTPEAAKLINSFASDTVYMMWEHKDGEMFEYGQCIWTDDQGQPMMEEIGKGFISYEKIIDRDIFRAALLKVVARKKLVCRKGESKATKVIVLEMQ